MSQTTFERTLLAGLRAANLARPTWTETILLNGVGAASSIDDYGDGFSYNLKSPSGYKGKVVGVSVYGITETFTNTTTGARVDIGNSADQAAYARTASLGTAAAASPACPAVTFNDYIPGGSTFIVKGVPATGGTPAGQARTAITIKWVQE